MAEKSIENDWIKTNNKSNKNKIMKFCFCFHTQVYPGLNDNNKDFSILNTCVMKIKKKILHTKSYRK